AGLSRYSSPANISQPAQTDEFGRVTGFRLSNPVDPSCRPPLTQHTAFFPLACGMDANAFIDILPPSEKTTVFGRFTGQLNPDTQFFAEASRFHGYFSYR